MVFFYKADRLSALTFAQGDRAWELRLTEHRFKYCCLLGTPYTYRVPPLVLYSLCDNIVCLRPIAYLHIVCLTTNNVAHYDVTTCH